MTAAEDHDSIAGWLAQWGECIASLDFARARTLFVPGVVGFGTFSDLLVGLDDLEARQWRAVWPAISDFRFELDGLWTEVSPDRRLGHLAAGWASTGTREGWCPVPTSGTLHGDPAPGGHRLAVARHPHPFFAEPRHPPGQLPEPTPLSRTSPWDCAGFRFNGLIFIGLTRFPRMEIVAM